MTKELRAKFPARTVCGVLLCAVPHSACSAQRNEISPAPRSMAQAERAPEAPSDKEEGPGTPAAPALQVPEQLVDDEGVLPLALLELAKSTLDQKLTCTAGYFDGRLVSSAHCFSSLTQDQCARDLKIAWFTRTPDVKLARSERGATCKGFVSFPVNDKGEKIDLVILDITGPGVRPARGLSKWDDAIRRFDTVSMSAPDATGQILRRTSVVGSVEGPLFFSGLVNNPGASGAPVFFESEGGDMPFDPSRPVAGIHLGARDASARAVSVKELAWALSKAPNASGGQQ